MTETQQPTATAPAVDLFLVPSLLNPAAQVWATRCRHCHEVVRLGYGDQDTHLRVLATTPALCPSHTIVENRKDR